MDSYIFGAGNLLHVHGGVIGVVADCRVFVFQYEDEGESAGAFKYAIKCLDGNPKFEDRVPIGNRYEMVDREKELIVIDQTGRTITVVIGRNQDAVRSTSKRIVENLKRSNLMKR